MKLIVVVNRPSELQDVQTTSMIVAEARNRGHDVKVIGVGQLELQPDGRTTAMTSEGRLEILPGEVVLVRTNPGRDDRPWAHEAAVEVLLRAQQAGVTVVNDPRGLSRAASKLFLFALPEEIRPRTLVTRHAGAIEEFVASAEGDVILKPVRGTRGQDVFRVRRGTENLRQVVDVLTRQGFAMVQDFVKGGEFGDVRVLLLNGKVLRSDGRPAVVARVPPSDDFRSNVAVGGTPAPASLKRVIQRVATLSGPVLVEHGMMLAGLDVIGDRVVEVNVFSPGGLYDASRFHGVDFVGPIVDALEELV